jgi:hypothetical protein
MKYFILIFLIWSCGKNEIPKQVDLRDSDGDGRMNNEELSEIEKYTADIAPLEDIKLEMRIKIAGSISTELRVNMSNQIDIIKHSRELLLGNPKKSLLDEYFSEWSKMKIESKKTPTVPEESSFRIDLCFSPLGSNPDKLFLVSKEGRRELSDWSPIISLSLPRKELEDILNGESFFSLGRNKKVYQNSTETQDQSVKNKTYRVFLSNGISTKIYYIANDYPFESFLKEQHITKYQDISHQNLMKAKYLTTTPEWWINDINGKDKVVVKDDLKSLSTFYIQGLEKSQLSVVRDNGLNVKSATLTNSNETLILLRIRANRFFRTFNQRTVNSSISQGGGGRNPNGGGSAPENCQHYYRDIASEGKLDLSEPELREALIITSNGVKASMSPSELEIESGIDDKGVFYDIAFVAVNTTIELKLKDLDHSSFQEVGLYQTTCRGTRLNKFLSNSESFLDLSIEAYVDKL